MTTADDQIRALTHPTLVVHGREDQIIPVSTSLPATVTWTVDQLAKGIFYIGRELSERFTSVLT